MKLTDADRAAIAEICKTHRYANTGERYQWSSALYEAGYRAGVEASAKVCAAKPPYDMGLSNAEYKFDASPDFAAAVRALLD